MIKIEKSAIAIDVSINMNNTSVKPLIKIKGSYETLNNAIKIAYPFVKKVSGNISDIELSDNVEMFYGCKGKLKITLNNGKSIELGFQPICWFNLDTLPNYVECIKLRVLEVIYTLENIADSHIDVKGLF